MSAYRGGAINVWQQQITEFMKSGTMLCPDCGIELPAGDNVETLALRREHYAVCDKRQRHIVDMTPAEARLCVDSIHAHIRHARALILELYERKGWQALGYTSWRACVSAEFEQSQTHMYRQLAAAFVEQVIVPDSPIGEIPESHLRPITGLTETQSQIVWQVVEDTAPNGKVTAAHVKSVVNVLKEVTATGALDDGTGEQIPVAAATREHLKAAVTEETYERLKRQEAYIEEKQAAKKRGVPPALTSSESNEYYTPAKYLTAVRTLLGGIDLDPASNPEANRVVQAAQFYSQSNNGLAYEWRGRVFLNPPYGYDAGDMSNQERWSARLIEQYEAGITTEAILLVNAVTDRQWFQPLWKYPICFTDHRIRFYRPGGEPGTPVIGSVFVYFGANHMEFARVFRQFGAVVLAAIQGNDDDAK